MDTPLVLFSTDRLGWCFDNIAKAVSLRLSEQFRFKIMPYAKIAREECDVLVALCWERALYSKANTRCKAMVPCLYDHLSWNINEDSFAHFRLTLKNSAAIGVCNAQMEAELRERVPPHELPPVFLLEDGVDTTLFHPLPLPGKLAVGWCGNAGRMTPGGPTDYKGLELIRKACTEAGVTLRILDTSGGGIWPHARMPIFYQDISVQIIGSALEGTPNPLLEAMAMGRPVITTPVGLAPKMVEHGVNGWLVERDVDSMVQALSDAQSKIRIDLVEMGKRARRTAQRWDWKVKAKPWLECLNLAKLGTSVARTHVPIEVQTPPSRVSVEEMERSAPVKPRTLLISDVPDWAFHQNMKDLAEYTSDIFDHGHWFVIDWLSDGRPFCADDYDAVFCVYHRWGIDALLPWDRTVGSLRALWFKPEKQLPAGPEDFKLVNRFRAFHVVTQQNYDELREHCPNVVYLTNPVNMSRFPQPTEVDDRLVASWNGNAQHFSAGRGIDVKGFHSIIKPVMDSSGLPFEYAEYNTKRLSPAEMPAFYARANLSICMSLFEGASNSTMEAMAAGQALISTDVGNVVEMQAAQLHDFGDTGVVIIERSGEALLEALNTLRANPARILEMGRLNREEIYKRWSWSAWRDRYVSFLKTALN